MPDRSTIDAFFDEATFTVTYLVSDPASGRGAIVDPVRDYDHRSGKVSTVSADRARPRNAASRSTGFSKRMPTPTT